MDVKAVLFLLLAVVAMGRAQDPCCYPDQFEISLGTTVGLSRPGKGSSAVNEVAETGFDYTNKRQGGSVTLYVGGKVISFKFVQDFKAEVQYIFEESEKRCKKHPNPGPMPHCVYANATSAGSVYLGDNKLTIDNFLYSLKEKKTAGQVFQSVTHGDCLPSSLTFQGVVGEAGVLSLTGYYNYVSGISDPAKYFTVPDYCPKSFSKEPRMYIPYTQGVPLGTY